MHSSLDIIEVEGMKHNKLANCHRYTQWIVNQGTKDENIVKGYLTQSLKLMVDANDKVQEAACTALSRISYEGTRFVEHYIGDVIQVMSHNKK